MDVEEILTKNVDKLKEEKTGSLSLSNYLEKVSSEPKYGSHAAKYMIEAIESAGTREIIEEGEKKERYRFFDDIYNDGQNAVLGNTDELNSFVENIRNMARCKGGMDKMMWVVGPTATGKSELKRCLINGLREYSKTEEGKRYTISWKVNEGPTTGKLGFINDDVFYDDESGEWIMSPVQENPLKLLYEEVRGEYLSNIEEETGQKINVEGNLSPFDRSFLKEKGVEGYQELFESTKEMKIVDYVMDRGQGIGILQSEDEGTPKQRIVGKWSRNREDVKRYGSGDPRVFEYSGVFSKGNNGLTVLEDVIQHQDVLQKLLNIPEERQVEIGDSMQMDLDTVIMLISNPDLENKLSQKESLEDKDPARALKRRMKKQRFRYLTNYSLETELLRREVSNEYDVWKCDSLEDKQEKVAEHMYMEVGDREVEISPHTLEAAALYNVVTRLEDDMELSEEMEELEEDDFGIIDKAMLYDKGFLKRGLFELEKDDFEFTSDKKDGMTGVPVTYTREKILEKVEDMDDKYSHILMPSEILDYLSSEENLEKSSVSEREIKIYKQIDEPVRRYILGKQEEDFLEALLHDKKPSESEIVNYVDEVADWYNETEDDEDINKFFMRVFEVEELEMFEKSDYDGVEPSSEVEEFRESEIYDGIRKLAQEKGEEFKFSEDVTEIDVLKDRVVQNSWKSVFRHWENFDPSRWVNPPGGTETEEVKEKAIDNMVNMFGYSEDSAKIATYKVIREISEVFERSSNISSSLNTEVKWDN